MREGRKVAACEAGAEHEVSAGRDDSGGRELAGRDARRPASPASTAGFEGAKAGGSQITRSKRASSATWVFRARRRRHPAGREAVGRAARARAGLGQRQCGRTRRQPPAHAPRRPQRRKAKPPTWVKTSSTRAPEASPWRRRGSAAGREDPRLLPAPQDRPCRWPRSSNRIGPASAPCTTSVWSASPSSARDRPVPFLTTVATPVTSTSALRQARQRCVSPKRRWAWIRGRARSGSMTTPGRPSASA